MFISLGYLDCWRRDYTINSGTTGTIHEAAAMTTVGYFSMAAWEMQRETLHFTAKSRRTLLWDWSHDSSPRSYNHILPFTYSYYTRGMDLIILSANILEMDEYDMFGNMENRLVKHNSHKANKKNKNNLHINHRVLIFQKTVGKLISHKYRLNK